MCSILQVAALIVVFCSAQSFIIQTPFENDHSTNTVEDDEFTVSALLERANSNIGQGLDDPLVIHGDIAVKTGLQNADPCTAKGCRWPKDSCGNVNVPYRISAKYSTRERNCIMGGLRSFAQSTCVRFIPQTRQQDFLDIQSLDGCYSYVGRRGGRQELSLDRIGCIYQSTIQHELLHALGFDHEQTRSDRDQHVRILLQNVIPGEERNFDRVQTNNLGTPYDYNSVMQYSRFAFSKNREPTILPIPDNSASIGRATRMSPNDILRVNRLYGCK